MKNPPSLLYIYVLFYSLFVGANLFAQDINSADTLNTPKNFQKLLDSSNTFYNEGKYTKSLELNTAILNMAFALDNPYYIHQGYRYLAYDYLILNDTILAIENIEKSERYAKLSKNDTATAVTYMDLANIYSTNENYKKAYVYHKKSINLFEKIKDSAGMAKAYYNTALTALYAKNYATAYRHILKAKDLNKFENHGSFSIGLNNFLGEYYVEIKDYENANLSLLKAIKSAKKDSLSVELENAYYFYSQSLFGQEKYKEAYEAFEIYDEYSDKNSGIYTSSERYAITEKIQLDEYRKDVKAATLQNELQKEILKNRGRLNIFLIILSACFLGLFLLIFIASRKRKILVRELKIKNIEYLKAKEESEKLSKSKSNFFSTISHELRTPLYGVIGLSTILLDDTSLKKHKNDLKSLKFSADYLLALINDVLHINKIDSQKIEDEQTVFNVRDLIETIASSFEYMRLQNNNKIRITFSKDIPILLSGNPIQISRILMNLIGNAYKFTENGIIDIVAKVVKTKEAQTKINFIVKDTGIGIAKEKQESIFDEFAQVDSKSYSYQGTGLGLPIVKKLLRLSNSKIELESETGKGSSFSFTLEFNIPEKVDLKEKPPIADTKILKGKKILIVEDNRINQIVTQKILEKNGIICAIAENGEEAISFVQKETFDLVLMDINMPVKNGMEASKEIRIFNKTIPIIALTAVEIEEVRYQIFQSGMNDIIIKPYDVTKFIQTIVKNITLEYFEDKNASLKAI